MRTYRFRFEVTVLESLWIAIENHIKSDENTKISHVFETTGQKLLQDPKPLPIIPNRRVTIRAQRATFNEEFPMKRTSIYVEAVLLQQLFNVYESLAIKHYGEGTTIDTKTMVNTVFYYYAKTNHLSFDERYFDQEYFNEHYTYSDKRNIKAYNDMVEILGKSPTLREWRNYRDEVNGPSETYILERYGTYSEFKEFVNNHNEEQGR